MGERYPRLEINLAHLKHNVVKVVEKCGDMGIQVAGVIKGVTGLPEVAKAFDEGGVCIHRILQTGTAGKTQRTQASKNR